MGFLIAGLLIWSLVHLVPAMAPKLKQAWTGALGENGYKGTFALLILLSLALIVFGWRHTIPVHLYLLPPAVKHSAMFLVLIAFVLFGASQYPTRIKSVIRHPQLTGVIVWAVAHLLMNGDSRAMVLFGSMGTWALLEIILINRRDGVWVKPEPPAWTREIRGLAISLVIFVVVILIHPYITGVPVG
jgi:uncharacterized membrane protein